ncbi:hypothetical protein PsYK624_153280 [Phanerochaete sordida]|uniref:Heterokaryon incompatibility domain-containing protein n=1 Tax=Phanerochaete sordida TaxID=48140 RepID=A0A9P3LL68_9APHY|nr:hypothetical protein PsYK624_153280 [Phanerochaete sordida]
MATSYANSAQELFRTSGTSGASFTLRPEPRSIVTFQAAHCSSLAIPDFLADMPCDSFTPEELLDLLNDVFGTSHAMVMDDGDMRPGLRSVIRSSWDFGCLYGILRTTDGKFWDKYITGVTRRAEDSRRKDEVRRRAAMRGGYIAEPHLPPRRLWDLCSNRVLPACVLLFDLQNPYQEQYFWPVSHSWVATEDLAYVYTPINGRQWPVPIPAATTLEHVRVELLNLGARYVWLDVLCLRQRGEPSDEEKRVEEWKLDVPTIGSIFAHDLPCVTYFNGLGLPFDPSLESMSSERHWLNRVWTVQEATRNWLPGGLTGLEAENAAAFFRQYYAQAIPPSDFRDVISGWNYAVVALRERHCTTELDRVHSLAYILKCTTLPVYDERMPPEVAWAMLLKHLHPYSRAKVAIYHMEHFPEDDALLPSLSDFMRCEMHHNHHVYPDSALHLLNSSSLGTPEPGRYYQEVSAMGPVSLARVEQDGDSFFELYFLSGGRRLEQPLCRLQDQKVAGSFSSNTTYHILKVGVSSWIIAEVVGSCLVNGETASEVQKRGCILLWLAPERILSHLSRQIVVHSSKRDVVLERSSWIF